MRLKWFSDPQRTLGHKYNTTPHSTQNTADDDDDNDFGYNVQSATTSALYFVYENRELENTLGRGKGESAYFR